MRVIIPAFCVFIFSCKDDCPINKKPIENISSKPRVLSLSYEAMRKNIDSSCFVIKQRYLKAKSPIERNAALTDAGDALQHVISQDLFSYWQGTPWDFNGTTTVPKRGSIACGYFVTTLLRDAGFKLNRIKLSTCPSFTMMKELTSSASIKNMSCLTFEAFVDWLRRDKKGVYVAGLDYHTGFVVKDDADVWFVHSNYIGKVGVMKERLLESAAFKASKTRYITCLTNNEKFLRNWLLN